MNTSTLALLQKHFDIALEAPDGIKRLRELILTLAMQGKLVPQDPNDQPARELLKEIEAEKKRLVKEGKIKAPKPLPEIKPEDVPYAVPVGWEWVRLGEMATYNGRDTAKPNDITNDTWVLDLEDIEKDTSKIIYRAKYAERQSKSNKSLFKCGDVLFGKLRPYLNKVVVADCDGVCTTEIVPIVPTIAVNSFFLLWLMKRPAFIAHVNAMSYGVKMPRLGTDTAANSLHPLPPLAEQKRIVAKIDQLMATCDALEKLRDSRQKKRLDVHTAALTRLLNGANPADAEAAWAFLQEHFGELYSAKANVAELRKAILQLAVMGKLVPQDPNDQPASELLKEIDAEKKHLIKEGKIKAPKPLPEVKPEDVPYAVPAGWAWVRLGEIGETQTGTTPMTKDADNYGNYIPFIGPGDIKNQSINYSGEGLSEKGLQAARLIEPGSVLMVCIGGSIGKRAINSQSVACNQQINTITPFILLVNYLFYSMGAGFFQDAVIGNAGGSATPIINKQKWSSIPIPLPPLAEQKRIVAKIDQLMALCDKLDQGIDAATQKQSAVLAAVLAQV